MQLLAFGASAFVVGFILIVVGRALEAARSKRNSRGLGGGELLQPFMEWLLITLKNEWPILTGKHTTVGDRLAAAGALIAAVGLLGIIGGIIASVLNEAAS